MLSYSKTRIHDKSYLESIKYELPSLFTKTKIAMKKKLLILLVVGAVVGGAVYLYTFYKPHRNVQGEKSAFTLSSANLIGEFQTDQTAATEKYIDKVIEIAGTVTDVNASNATLDGSVYCSFLEGELSKVVEIGQGKTVTLKGRVIGFDELFGEVRLDQCAVIQ